MTLHQGQSRLAFAKEIGVPESTLGNYERGARLPDAEFLANLHQHTGADLNWLVTGKGLSQLQQQGYGTPDGFVAVPRLDIRASAGGGLMAFHEDPEPERIVAFREDFLRHLGVSPRHAQIIVADGDSMSPTIKHGDLVLVDRSIDRVINDGIYVLVHAGLVKLKRVQVLRDGAVILKSDNGAYAPENIPPRDVPELQVEARVRWTGGAI